MNKDLCNKLKRAITNYNDAQEHESEKIDTQNMLTEIGELDNEQLEKAIKEINKQSEQ